jgi:hypothetical protein
MVDLDVGGFSELRPGLSAQVAFFVEARRDVVRIPAHAIRWVGNKPFAALMTSEGPRWRELKLGLLNDTHAELISGLALGDKVVSNPDLLSPPSAGTPAKPATKVGATPAAKKPS